MEPFPSTSHPRPYATTNQFFADLPVHALTLSELLGQPRLFKEVPRAWHVVVTDIENSTAAVTTGRHEDVNLIATGSIIATLNLAHRAGTVVPFFFGGDGATLIVPESLLQPTLEALNRHRLNTLDNFGLTLRVGSVPVAALYRDGYTLSLARLRVSDLFSIPVLLGHGLSEAERRIKGLEATEATAEAGLLDLEGMECRWDRIEPEVSSHEIVSLLVTTPDGQPQAPVFKRVVEMIDAYYGPPALRNPVTAKGLHLRGSWRQIAREMRTRLGRFSLWYLLRNWLVTRFGKYIYFRGRKGQAYLHQLVEFTDTLVIDGRINTVIAGAPDQRRRLEAGLAQMEREGLITFGLYVSRESVMSCYVSDRANKHIHFVDGADGGYTRAAGMWKMKRRPA